MTTDQSISAKPVQNVVPLQQRGDEQSDQARLNDFFDLASDTMAAVGISEDDRATAAALIAAAHDARMKGLDAKRMQAERATHAYASMDRAHQDLLHFVKRTTSQFLEINARLHAEREAFAHVRHEVLQHCKDLDDRGAEVIGVKTVQALCRMDVPPTETRPVIVSMATDQRFSFGIFEQADTPGATTQRTFLGWSLVVDRPQIRTLPEPTFLDVDGTPKTASQLQHEGYTLKHLS